MKLLRILVFLSFSTSQPITPYTYMYFTDSEHAGGGPFVFNWPNERRNVNFVGGDIVRGIIQTNEYLTMTSNQISYCPDFSEATVYFTENIVPNIYLGICGSYNNLFDGIPDTITQPPFPLPHTEIEILKSIANYVYDASLKIDLTALKDTLIMTDIEFLNNGTFKVKQWWYLMPPHFVAGVPLNEMVLSNPLYLEGGDFSGGGTIDDNQGDCIMDPVCVNGYCEYDGVVAEEYECIFNSNCSVDLCKYGDSGLWIENGDCNTDTECVPECTNDVDVRTCVAYEDSLKAFHAKYVNSSGEDELLNTQNAVWGTHGLHHYDFEPLDIIGNPNPDALLLDIIENGNDNAIIYVKDGPVRVRGTYIGKYAIITDEYTIYRRHATQYLFGGNDMVPRDTVWNNIWLTGDLINEDALDAVPYYGNMQNYQPDDNCENGSENNMSLISGANVIVANTQSNRNNITINSGIIALNESFVAQYWQNTISTNCGYINGEAVNCSSAPWGDSRGIEKYSSTGYIDNRGTIKLWGGIVQKYRGYMIRKLPSPYNNENAGVQIGYYDEDYYYDANLKCNEYYIYSCNDPLACNFNQNSTTNIFCFYYEDNGLCDCEGNIEDCYGVCGGNAFQNECGCVEGLTGFESDFCHGCTDETACNYDSSATIDNQTCDYDFPEGTCDCDGNVLDCTGVCGGTTVVDCSGECGGSAVVDECGECDGDGIADGVCDCDGNVLDCSGECGGSAVVDECGECDGDGIADGVCDCDGNIDNCLICPYINSMSYGDCNIELGYAFTGSDCELIFGCGYGNHDFFFDTYSDCINNCPWMNQIYDGCVNDCQNCKLIDSNAYGNCNVELGYAFNGNECELVYGCGVGDDGVWFYEDIDTCMIRCNFTSLDTENLNIQSAFSIKSIIPNPFNPTTSISISLPEQSQISLQIYDIKGNIISTLLNQTINVGHHQIDWNAEGYPSGVYFVKLDAGEFTQTQKLMLVK